VACSVPAEEAASAGRQVRKPSRPRDDRVGHSGGLYLPRSNTADIPGLRDRLVGRTAHVRKPPTRQGAVTESVRDVAIPNWSRPPGSLLGEETGAARITPTHVPGGVGRGRACLARVGVLVTPTGPDVLPVGPDGGGALAGARSESGAPFGAGRSTIKGRKRVPPGTLPTGGAGRS